MKLIATSLSVLIAGVAFGADPTPTPAAKAPANDALGDYQAALNDTSQGTTHGSGSASTGSQQPPTPPPGGSQHPTATIPPPPTTLPAAPVLVTTPLPDVAAGKAILPDRPTSAFMKFAHSTAAEAALRFADEYRVSVVFSGDGTTPVNGEFSRCDDLVAMAQKVFPSPDWTVSKHGESLLISERETLICRKITLADLNPQGATP